MTIATIQDAQPNNKKIKLPTTHADAWVVGYSLLDKARHLLGGRSQSFDMINHIIPFAITRLLTLIAIEIFADKVNLIPGHSKALVLRIRLDITSAEDSADRIQALELTEHFLDDVFWDLMEVPCGQVCRGQIAMLDMDGICDSVTTDFIRRIDVTRHIVDVDVSIIDDDLSGTDKHVHDGTEKVGFMIHRRFCCVVDVLAIDVVELIGAEDN